MSAAAELYGKNCASAIIPSLALCASDGDGKVK